MSKIELMFLIIFLGNVEKSVSAFNDDSENAYSSGAVKIGEWEKDEKFDFIFCRLFLLLCVWISKHFDLFLLCREREIRFSHFFNVYHQLSFFLTHIFLSTGGLFPPELEDPSKDAKIFEFAIKYFNIKETEPVKGKGYFNFGDPESEPFQLEAVIKDITFGNEFEASQNVCNLIEVSSNCSISVIIIILHFNSNNNNIIIIAILLAEIHHSTITTKQTFKRIFTIILNCSTSFLISLVWETLRVRF